MLSKIIRVYDSAKRIKANAGAQRGGAALLVTIILAVILLSVVSGLATLSIRELKQSSQTEQSNRALSAAESYVDKIANDITLGRVSYHNNCSGTGATLPSNLTITCAVVYQATGNEIKGTLDRDKSVRIDLSNAYTQGSDGSIHPADVAYAKLEWGSKSYATTNAFGSSWPGLRDGDNWGYQAAPELTTVSWGLSGSKIDIIDPSDGDSYGLPISKTVLKPGSNSPGANITSTCDTDSVHEYVCRTDDSVGIGGIRHKGYAIYLDGQVVKPNLVYKLAARYNSMNYRLTFYDASDHQLTFKLPYITIDVTARSDNLYRRVVAQKTSELTQQFSILDSNVLFSGTNICKNLKVGSDWLGVNGGNGKNTVNCE